MAAARHEGEKWRLHGPLAERAREHVPVEVVDRRERQAPGGGQRLGRRDTDQKGADEPGAARHGNPVDVVERCAGLLERVRDDRVDQLEVPARGDLRYDPPVTSMQEALGGDYVRPDLAGGRHDRGACVVAARLDAEDQTAAAPGSREATVRHMITASSLLSW